MLRDSFGGSEKSYMDHLLALLVLVPVFELEVDQLVTGIDEHMGEC